MDPSRSDELFGTQADALVVARCDHFVVDEEFQLLAGNEFADAEVLDRELVFAIGREAVPDRHPAARAERQALDVLVLRGVAGAM